jgi:ATP adenylyltransferase
MDRLWTPWRFEYVSTADQADAGCVFCQVLSEDRDEDNFVLFRSTRAFCILNRFPYTSGHILIVANRHISFLNEATSDELQELIDLAKICERALRSEYHPDGYNMGFNLGRAAGAGVAHHLHMHVLPRWVGDASFVSVVSETRVIPEELPKTYHRLAPYFLKSTP